MRGLRTIPVLLVDVRRHGGALPRRVVPQLHEPDGDQLPRDQPGEQHPHRRPVPQRAGHRVRALDRSRDPVPRDRLPRRGHQPHGVLPALRARRRRPLPAAAGARRRRARCPSATACATRCCAASATSSPSRASTSPSTCRGSSSATGPISSSSSTCRSTSTRGAASSRSRAGRRSAARLEGGDAIEVQPSFEYAATIIRSIETGKPRVIYGNVPNDGLIDDLPGGLHGRGAVPRRRQRRAADADRRAAAAARRADPHERQRAGAHGRGRAHRPARARVPRGDARPAHRGRARPRPDPRRSSTRCSTAHGDWIPPLISSDDDDPEKGARGGT